MDIHRKFLTTIAYKTIDTNKNTEITEELKLYNIFNRIDH